MDACAALLLWTSLITGLEPSRAPTAKLACPPIEYRPAQVMDRRLNAARGTPQDACQPWARYIDGTIVLRAEWQGSVLGAPWPESILVHELTHHLQTQALGPPRTRRSLLKRERWAQAVQAKWLRLHGHTPNLTKTFKCGSPDGDQVHLGLFEPRSQNPLPFGALTSTNVKGGEP